MIPPRAHRETCVRGKAQAEAGKIIGEKEDDCQRNDDRAQRGISRGDAEGLRNCADDIDLVGRDVRKNRAGAEDVQQRDDWRGDQYSAREIAAWVARLSGENGRVFETAQRAEGHFAEYAETEES